MPGVQAGAAERFMKLRITTLLQSTLSTKSLGATIERDDYEDG
jgi:hypothetical protein